MLKRKISKKVGRRLISLAIAAAMTAVLAVPSMYAVPVSAAQKESTVKEVKQTADTGGETSASPVDAQVEADSSISAFGNAILNSNGKLWSNIEQQTAKGSGKKIGTTKGVAKVYDRVYISTSGNVILNKESKNLWYRLKQRTAKYMTKSGIEKAYDRIYLDENESATFFLKNNAQATREGVQDIGRFSMLLKDGTLVDAYTDKVIAENVQAWYEADARDGQQSLILDKEGNVSLFANGKLGKKLDVAQIVKDINRGTLLAEDGTLYNLTFAYDSNYNETDCKVVQADTGVEKLAALNDPFTTCVGYFYIKDGQTYEYIPGDEYAGKDNIMRLDKEIVSYKVLTGEGNGEYLAAAKDGSVYRVTLDEEMQNTSEQLADSDFDHFTKNGYYLKSNRTYYDNEGTQTTIIFTEELDNTGTDDSASKKLEFKSDGILYLNGEVLLENVAKCSDPWTGQPLIIVKQDKTIWLYDWMELQENRKAIEAPSELTEELVKELYEGVPKVEQTIAAAAEFTKNDGDEAFNLDAATDGDGILTYESQNPEVAEVDAYGDVTLKNPGQTVITITASETETYLQATKEVKIIVRENSDNTEPSTTLPEPTQPEPTKPNPTQPAPTTPEPTDPSVTDPTEDQAPTEPTDPTTPAEPEKPSEPTKPAVAAPVKTGDVVTDKKTQGVYKVINTKGKEKSVAYQKTTNKNVDKIIIPATLKISGETYKVTAIADNAAKNNKKLQTVKISANIKTIGKNAFNNCTKLKKLTFGKNVTTIGKGAFKGCTDLRTIVIPEKVSKIGAGAFANCKKLEKMTVKTKKLTGKQIGKNAFKNIPRTAVVDVPNSKLKAYKKAFRAKGLNSKIRIK